MFTVFTVLVTESFFPFFVLEIFGFNWALVLLVRYFGSIIRFGHFVLQCMPRLKSMFRGWMFIILSNEAIWDEVGKNIHQRFVEYMNLTESLLENKNSQFIWLVTCLIEIVSAILKAKMLFNFSVISQHFKNLVYYVWCN